MSDTKREARRKPPNKHQPTMAELGTGHRDPSDAGSPRGPVTDRRGTAMIDDRLGDD